MEVVEDDRGVGFLPRFVRADIFGPSVGIFKFHLENEARVAVVLDGVVVEAALVEVAVAEKHRDGIVALPEHVGDVVGEVKGPVGCHSRVKRNPRVDQKLWPCRVVGQARSKEVVTDFVAVEGHFEPSQTADEGLCAGKFAIDLELFSEYRGGIVVDRTVVVLPRCSDPFCLPVGVVEHSRCPMCRLSPAGSLSFSIPDADGPPAVFHGRHQVARVLHEMRLAPFGAS